MNHPGYIHIQEGAGEILCHLRCIGAFDPHHVRAHFNKNSTGLNVGATWGRAVIEVQTGEGILTIYGDLPRLVM